MTSHALSADPSATVCRLSQSEPRPATCQLDLSGLRGGLVLGTASQHQCTTLLVPGSGHAPLAPPGRARGACRAGPARGAAWRCADPRCPSRCTSPRRGGRTSPRAAAGAARRCLPGGRGSSRPGFSSALIGFWYVWKLLIALRLCSGVPLFFGRVSPPSHAYAGPWGGLWSN